jgi:predicted nuclease with TOPRIM domain
MNKEIELKPSEPITTFSMHVANQAGVIFTIMPDLKLEFGEGVTPKEAAKAIEDNFQCVTDKLAQLQAENTELHGEIAFLKAELKAEQKRVDNYHDNMEVIEDENTNL